MGCLTVPKIDVVRFIEQSGVRKARFGGYEPDDVRQAMLALCAEYEQRLTKAENVARKYAQDNAALEQHCQTLTAQNQKLSGQSATLAGSSEKYARQMDELSNQLSSLQERNHSLSDQIAVFRLKNSDLTQENDSLKERADQAEAALRIKGRAMDAEKAAWDAARAQRESEAEAEAAQTVAKAEAEAQKTAAAAALQAEAVDRAARAQARAQAQRLVDAAAAEANEIQNAHQLRLNNLHAEVRGMERRRDELVAYLNRMGSELLRVKALAENETPAEAQPLPAAPGEEAELREVPTPEAVLDLSAAALAGPLAAVRAEHAAHDALKEADIQSATTPLVQMEPDAPGAARRPAFTLLADEPAPPPFTPAPTYFEDPAHQTGPALTEVPGAIFSAPVVRQGDGPLPEETPPTAAPRAPVMPMLPDDEDDAGDMADQSELNDAPDAAPAYTPQARRKALRALRALRRRTAKGGVR